MRAPSSAAPQAAQAQNRNFSEAAASPEDFLSLPLPSLPLRGDSALPCPRPAGRCRALSPSFPKQIPGWMRPREAPGRGSSSRPPVRRYPVRGRSPHGDPDCCKPSKVTPLEPFPRLRPLFPKVCRIKGRGCMIISVFMHVGQYVGRG